MGIDWRNFVLVETIDFNQEEIEFLPQPKLEINDIQELLAAAKLAQQQQQLEQQEAQAQNEIDNENIEEDNKSTNANNDDNVSNDVNNSMEDIEIRTGVANNIPGNKSSAASLYQRCPRCGSNILLSELESHMKIELLDPKWKQQKVSAQEKQKETSFASGISIAENLRRLAKAKYQQNSNDNSDTNENNLVPRLQHDEPNNINKDNDNTINNNLFLPPNPNVSTGIPPMASNIPFLQTQPIMQSFYNNPNLNNATTNFMPPTMNYPVPTIVSPIYNNTINYDSNEPQSKKLKADNNLGINTVDTPANSNIENLQDTTRIQLSESEYLNRYGSNAISVSIQFPSSDSSNNQFNFKGQLITLSNLIPHQTTIEQLKLKVLPHTTGLTANKIKLFSQANSTFLNKDNLTLAYYNIINNDILTLQIKERGGRKK
jgi:splicing factor 3A subunit 1